ncbi:hypothetical protein [Anaerolentibacter hominis]|uniref:hypothetical protein n=1 Tax=Anaerolentibacter hominis TaxID=3079009 RepID=UPI0031B87E3D
MHKSIYFILVLFLLLPCSAVSAAEERPTVRFNEDTGNYEYIYSLDSKEIQNADSMQEIWELFQVPDSILEEITTSQLLDLVLLNPYTGDLSYFDTMQMGLESLKERFNSIRELLKRDDLPDIVIKKYSTLSLSERLFDNTVQMMFLEAVLSQKSVLLSLDYVAFNKLIREIERQYTAMQKNSYYRGLTEIFSEAIASHFKPVCIDTFSSNKLYSLAAPEESAYPSMFLKLKGYFFPVVKIAPGGYFPTQPLENLPLLFLDYCSL